MEEKADMKRFKGEGVLVREVQAILSDIPNIEKKK